MGRVSRVPVVWNETHVYTLADHKIVRVREFRDREAALEAVGLSE